MITVYKRLKNVNTKRREVAFQNSPGEKREAGQN